MQGFNSFLMFLGRVGIALIFLLAGAHKLMNFEEYHKVLAEKGFQYIPVIILITALIELIGALSLILGWKTRWGATLLFLFLIPATLIFHNFWDYVEPVARQLQMNMFFKNLAIMGGLLYILAFSSGSISIDRFLKKKES
jgi:putative oxidoreductase